jgi:hypothetical protein
MPGPKIPRQYKKVPAGPYTVVNPRKIPQGIPVVTICDVNYYEGDTVAADVEVRDLIERGFLKPQKGGS